jgi:hypothetical protein
MISSTHNPSSNVPVNGASSTPAPPDTTAGAAPLLDTFQLFDIAERAAQVEATEWDEEPGMNLFLEDSVLLVRRELEIMPHVSRLRETSDEASPGPPDDSTSEYSKRARIFVMEGSFSAALKDLDHYKKLAKEAISGFSACRMCFSCYGGHQRGVAHARHYAHARAHRRGG